MHKILTLDNKRAVISFSDMESVLLHISGDHILNRLNNDTMRTYRIDFDPIAPVEELYILILERSIF